MTISELRILPPLAIGRLGEAAQPMDNYDMVVDPERPLGHRELRPAETLEVDTDSGEVKRSFVPEKLRFRDGDLARPVAPFLEVWAVTGEGVLEPLTTDLLAAEGAQPQDVRWSVEVANIKAFRRTDDPCDKIEASVDAIADHARHALLGTCEHFWPDRVLPLGHVQYIKPTAEFPQIRLRFTPAAGHVYGASKEPPKPGRVRGKDYVEVLYDGSRGKWLGYTDPDPSLPINTIPGQIYAGDDNGASLGYLDDECDGLVRVSLELGGRTLSSYARIGAGPPAYAPDGLPIRTIAQELEQALEGVDLEPGEATFEEVEEIVRRAFETIRLLNTRVMNGNTIDGRTNVASTMVSQDTNDTGRMWQPIMAPSLVDNLALEALHESLLVALRSGTAPWFADVLREYDEIGDLSDKGRRKMPAMMRGADGRYLTLTRRQLNVVKAIARGEVFPP